MLLDESRFGDFTAARHTTEAILCVSAESHEDVDELADSALRAGGSGASDAMDHGCIYGP
jgi:uncharacterized protein